MKHKTFLNSQQANNYIKVKDYFLSKRLLTMSLKKIKLTLNYILLTLSQKKVKIKYLH